MDDIDYIYDILGNMIFLPAAGCCCNVVIQGKLSVYASLVVVIKDPLG